MTRVDQGRPCALRCRICGEALIFSDRRWDCNPCGTTVPEAGGVPIFVDDPTRLLAAARQEIASTARLAEERLTDLRTLGTRTSLSALTSARLEELAQSQLRQSQKTAALIEKDIGDDRNDAFGFVPVAWRMADLVPWLIRDWGPVGELDAAEARIGRAISFHVPGTNRRAIAFPGCGAGGLALRLSVPFRVAFAYDLSLPTLAILAQIRDEGALDLELPPPLEAAGRLRRRGGENTHIHLLAMDAERTSFRDSSLDCVVTTFLLDLLPEPSRLVRELQRVLVPGGIWINYGPTGPRDGFWHFSSEEISLFAESHGFAVLETDRHRTTLFDFCAIDPSSAYQSHICHLLVAKKTDFGLPFPVFPLLSDKDEPAILAQIPCHYPGAVIETRRTPGRPLDDLIVFRHQRRAGRPESFAVGPGTAQALLLVDGISTTARLAQRMVSEGRAAQAGDAVRNYARLVEAEILFLKG